MSEPRQKLDNAPAQPLSERIAGLSPAKRALLEQRLRVLERQQQQSALTAIPRRAPDAAVPLSYGQERLWFLWQLDRDNPIYNTPVYLQCAGLLDLEVLTRALNAVIARHESCRTVFRTAQGRAVQVVLPPSSISIASFDLSQAADIEGRAATLQGQIVQEARRPFDLENGPVFRAAVWKVREEEHVILLVLHHSTLDRWSRQILHSDVAEFYRAYACGCEPPFSGLPIQYADFTIWQRGQADSEAFRCGLDWWRDELAGAPQQLAVPCDYARSASQAGRGAHVALEIGSELSAALIYLSRREGVTVFTILLTAWWLVLRRFSGQDDLIIGTPVAGRPRAETENLIGFFVNTLPLRIRGIADDAPFREALMRVRQIALAAFEHQDVPFEQIVEQMRVVRDPSRSPIAQAVFVMQNSPRRDIAQGPIHLTLSDLDFGVARFDLTLNIWPEGDSGLGGWLEYDSSLFDGGMARSLASSYTALLESIVAEPNRRCSELSLVRDAYRAQLMRWSGADIPGFAGRVHRLVEEQARREPHAVAVTGEGHEVTYAQLNASANRLAGWLRRKGVERGDMIAVCLRRSPRLIQSLLAILKCGAAYVPLDPRLPSERLAFLLDDTRASLTLTESRLLPLLQNAAGATAVDIEGSAGEIASHSEENLDIDGYPGDAACVMYTSGSSGSPKGVQVLHKGITRLVRGSYCLPLTPGEVFLQLAPLSFDASTLEIWGSLANGARLALYPGESLDGSVDLREVAAFVAGAGVTTLWLTAALFRQMVDLGGDDWHRGVRRMLAGGDVVSPEHVRRLLARSPNMTFINGYGPTENTTFTCCHAVASPDGAADPLPIGRPVGGTSVYLLDSACRLVPIGAPGELCTGGLGVAAGYLNNPELTARRFVPDPFSSDPAARLYRTGDLCRYRSDGTIEFLGRLDDQVKIRGYRIEPGEIEARIAEYPGVQECAVLHHRDADANAEKRLAAYIVPQAAGSSVDFAALREHLKARLPEYMMPSAFAFVDRMPLSANGKLDKRALLELSASVESAARPTAMPSEAAEKHVYWMWRQCFPEVDFGIDDDFFEIGGHSLLGAQLMAMIEEHTGKRLPLSLLFQTPTVRSLAQLIKDAELRDAEPVAIVQHGDLGRVPIFFLHGDMDGAGYYCRRIAQALDAATPFYSLHPAGFLGAMPSSVEDEARRHAEAIRRARPHGPYFIGGYCNGAIIAYELARQLAASGEEIADLILVELPRSNLQWRPILTLAEQLGNWSGVKERDRVAAFTRVKFTLRKMRHKHHFENSAAISAKRSIGADSSRRRLLVELYRNMLWAYRPQPYHGKLAALISEERIGWFSDRYLRLWHKLAPQISFESVAGSHVGIIRDDVEPLAQAIRARLDKAGVR